MQLYRLSFLKLRIVETLWILMAEKNEYRRNHTLRECICKSGIKTMIYLNSRGNIEDLCLLALALSVTRQVTTDHEYGV